MVAVEGGPLLYALHIASKSQCVINTCAWVGVQVVLFLLWLGCYKHVLPWRKALVGAHSFLCMKGALSWDYEICVFSCKGLSFKL